MLCLKDLEYPPITVSCLVTTAVRFHCNVVTIAKFPVEPLVNVNCLHGKKLSLPLDLR
mgnify:CR=1 FL=1